MGRRWWRKKKWFELPFWLVTLEFLLEWFANGSTIILVRAAWCTLITYGPVLMHRRWADGSGAILPLWRSELSSTWPWLGATFGAIYAAFYTRFASQWQYLAGVYNQIKEAECAWEIEGALQPSQRIAEWKAAFFEDCEELHLVRKRTFASILRTWAKNDAVRRAFLESAHGGRDRWDDLTRQVQTALGTALLDTGEKRSKPAVLPSIQVDASGKADEGTRRQ